MSRRVIAEVKRGDLPAPAVEAKIRTELRRIGHSDERIDAYLAHLRKRVQSSPK